MTKTLLKLFFFFSFFFSFFGLVGIKDVFVLCIIILPALAHFIDFFFFFTLVQISSPGFFAPNLMPGKMERFRNVGHIIVSV